MLYKTDDLDKAAVGISVLHSGTMLYSEVVFTQQLQSADILPNTLWRLCQPS